MTQLRPYDRFMHDGNMHELIRWSSINLTDGSQVAMAYSETLQVETNIGKIKGDFGREIG